MEMRKLIILLLFTTAPSVLVCAAEQRSGIHGIYSGWVDHANVGDDLVEDVFFAMLRSGLQRLARGGGAAVELQQEHEELPLCTEGGASPCDFGVLGGGSIIKPVYMRELKAAVEAGASLLIWGSGVQNAQNRTLGRGESPCSNPEFQADVCATLRQASSAGRLFGGVRGTRTQACVLAACQLELAVVADSGLLTASLFEAPALPADPPLVMLTFKESATTAFLDATFNASDPEVQFKVRLTLELLKHHRIVLVPVVRYPGQEQELHSYIHKTISSRLSAGAGGADTSTGGVPGLDASALDRLQVFNAPSHNYSMLSGLYKAAHLCYSERLHSGIISASAGTPCLFFADNMKFDDFASGLTGLSPPAIVMNSSATVQLHPPPTELLVPIQRRLKRLSTAHGLVSRALVRSVKKTLAAYEAQVSGFWQGIARSDTSAARLQALLACRRIVIKRSPGQGTKNLIRAIHIACGDER